MKYVDWLIGMGSRNAFDNLFMCVCTGCGHDISKTTGRHGKRAGERSVSDFIRLPFLSTGLCVCVCVCVLCLHLYFFCALDVH